MNKEDFKKIILDWYHNYINIPIVHTVSLDDEKRSDFIYTLLEQNNKLELFEDLYIETDPMNQFTDRFKRKKILKLIKSI
jgi:phage terminase large subunit-like protein